MKRKTIFVAVLAVALCIALCSTFFLGLYEKDTQENSESVASLVEAPENEGDIVIAFRQYSYVEQRADGSCDNVVIYRHNNDYILYDKFRSVGGEYGCQTVKLNDNMKSRWETALKDVMTVQAVDTSRTEFVSGTLYLQTESGESVYSVDPMDITGFGALDGWSADLMMCGDVPETYQTLFSVEDMKAITGIESKAELGAYLCMLYANLEAQADDDIVRVDLLSEPNDVVDFYTLQVTTTGDVFLADVTLNGYVFSTEAAEGSE